MRLEGDAEAGAEGWLDSGLRYTALSAAPDSASQSAPDVLEGPDSD